jgi:hypothetical protein
MVSWRRQQLQFFDKDFIIEQDAALINFINQNQIKSLALIGDPDAVYFQSRLPNCNITMTPVVDMLAVFETVLEIKLEDFLVKLTMLTQLYQPCWVYVAINKYVVNTDQAWKNLTDNYDNDLLDIITANIPGYREITRKYILNDNGIYFNFAHPTTNAYYRINRQ